MKWLSAILLSLTACASTGSSWNHLNQSERAEVLAKISQKCELPTGALFVNADGWAAISFPNDLKYERASCALAELKRVKVATLGFIGNEAYEPEKK